jgi:uncharacterized membrane protein
MTANSVRAVTTAAAVGSTLVGGTFFAFSTFVMPALLRLPPTHGLTAMQAINRAAPASGLFMAALGGTALASLGLAGTAATHLEDAQARYELLGSVLFLSCVAVTAVYHVPHNDSLALVDPTSPGATDAWLGYARGWVAWNHIRTITPLAAGVSFVLALRAR